jgi:hypothetical protein
VRRSNTTDEGSLELLLDTITNTFGGVLFISLLVVLLLQLRGSNHTVPLPNAETELTMISLQGELNRKTARLEETLEAIESNKQMKELLAGSLDPEDFATLQALQRTQESLYQQRDSMLQELTRIQKEINDKATQFNDNQQFASEVRKIQKEVVLLEDVIESIRNEQKKTRQAISTKKNSPTEKDMPLPKIRATSKEPCVVLVQHGELFVVTRNGLINTGHLVRVTDGQVIKGSEQFDVKTGEGLDVTRKTNLRERLRDVLGDRVTPREAYLVIAIYDNAFSHWEQLRDAILGGDNGNGITPGTTEPVSEGFRYRLVPFEEGVKVVFGYGSSGAQ